MRLSAAPEPLFRHTVLEFDYLHFKRKISRQKGTNMDRKVQEFDKKNNSRTITHGKYVISILNVFYPSHSSNQKFL